MPQIGLVSQTNTLLTWCDVLLALFVLFRYDIVFIIYLSIRIVISEQTCNSDISAIGFNKQN